jgi:cyclic pyranopterin phosphate synthase
MTTSGVGLADRARALREAGLQRVNVSLDTLRPERFEAMTGKSAHEEVLAGIAEALSVFAAVKTNTVLLQGRNDDEIESIVRFGARSGFRPRFVEYYRTGSGSADEQGVPMGVVRERVERAFGPLERVQGDPLSVESVYRIPSLGGSTVGFIASASAPPCEACSKLRVTATGLLLPCLFAERGTPLGPLLEAGDAPAVRLALRRAVAGKGGHVGPRRVRLGVWAVGG